MKLSDEITRKSLAWLARQAAAMRQEVFRAAMQQRRQTLNRLRALPDAASANTPEIEEQSLVTAILEIRRERLKSSDALEDIAASRASAARGSKNKRSPKWDRLVILMPQVLKLRDSGLNYAEIAKIVSKQTRKPMSKSHVFAAVKEYREGKGETNVP